MSNTNAAITSSGMPFTAFLLDLDGVLTGTARVHEGAWKETFDAFLERHGARSGKHFEPFTSDDYLRHVDGKTRMDGARAFLASRGIELPERSPENAPDVDSVQKLADRKNRRAVDLISPETVEVFPGSVALARALRARGIKTAVVSASENCRAVLVAAGISDLFDRIVDGKVIKEKHLRGKPAPDPFLEAARQLDVAPAEAVVVEDALAGVRAGREGGFGLVIGVDRRGNAAALRQAGAQLVVADVWEMLAGLAPGKYGPKLHKALQTARNVAAAEKVMVQRPWQLIVRRTPDEPLIPQLESILALSNGYLGVRGTGEEGIPSYRPATLLNGFHETWPITYAEDAYGLARTGQTIVSVPDGTRIRLFVEDSRARRARRDGVVPAHATPRSRAARARARLAARRRRSGRGALDALGVGGRSTPHLHGLRSRAARSPDVPYGELRAGRPRNPLHARRDPRPAPAPPRHERAEAGVPRDHRRRRGLHVPDGAQRPVTRLRHGPSRRRRCRDLGESRGWPRPLRRRGATRAGPKATPREVSRVSFLVQPPVQGARLSHPTRRSPRYGAWGPTQSAASTSR